MIDFMEHRAGIEPANTGFADRRYPLLSYTYKDYTTLKSPEKYPRELSQWCENGVAFGTHGGVRRRLEDGRD
jgi:hypothetical protein